MPPTTTAPSAPDYAGAVKKSFANNDSQIVFTVDEFFPAFDFGPRRKGKQPAFRIVRAGINTVSTVPAADFMKNHTLVPAAPAAP